jgi:hypothetical protein
LAKILGPLHSDRVKGSVSGVTYREYRGQASGARRGRPVRRQTTVLSNIRSIFSYLSKKWGTLSAADRQMWTDYAAAHPVPNGMGGTFQLDGNQYFMKLNHTCIRIGGAGGEAALPPVSEPPAVVDSINVGTGIGANTIDVTWTCLGTPDAGDFAEVQYAGPFNSAGRMSVGSRFKYFSDLPGTTLLETVTGLQADAWYWVRVRYITFDGQVSNWVYGQAKAAA